MSLELSRAPGDEPKVLPMDRDDVTGVVVDHGQAQVARAATTGYRVEVWHPAAQRIVTTSVTDPYSHALAVDSTHSQLVDLADPELQPPGWAELTKPAAVAPARMQIAELSRPRLLDRRHTVPPGPNAAPTWPSPTRTRPACGTCGRSPTPG